MDCKLTKHANLTKLSSLRNFACRDHAEGQ